MNLLDFFGYGLGFLALLLVVYALRCVCVARKHHKDPRPFALPVFSLLAFALMQGVLSASGAIATHNETLIGTWLAVEYSQVISTGWLLHYASKGVNHENI